MKPGDIVVTDSSLDPRGKIPFYEPADAEGYWGRSHALIGDGVPCLIVGTVEHDIKNFFVVILGGKAGYIWEKNLRSMQ